MMNYPQQDQDGHLLMTALCKLMPPAGTYPEGVADYTLGHWSFPPELMAERKLMGHRPQGKWLPDTEVTHVLGQFGPGTDGFGLLRMATDVSALYNELCEQLYAAPTLIDPVAGIVRWPKIARLGWTENGVLFTVHLIVAHFQYHHNPYRERTS